jgi:secreted trypsin-like serine protease
LHFHELLDFSNFWNTTIAMILQTFRTVMLCSFLISSLSFVICNADVKIMRDLRIVGGQITRPNQFPHAVALILHMPHSHTSFCGGSIIHANYVLTVSVGSCYFLITRK